MIQWIVVADDLAALIVFNPRLLIQCVCDRRKVTPRVVAKPGHPSKFVSHTGDVVEHRLVFEPFCLAQSISACSYVSTFVELTANLGATTWTGDRGCEISSQIALRSRTLSERIGRCNNV